LAVCETEYFTISEEALLEHVYNEPNYKFIFKNDEFLARLAENYKAHGCDIRDEDIIESFLVQEALAEVEVKKVFQEMREILGIRKPPKTEKEVAEITADKNNQKRRSRMSPDQRRSSQLTAPNEDTNPSTEKIKENTNPDTVPPQDDIEHKEPKPETA
jgi:hypothetical protein